MPRARANDLVITHLAAEGACNAASVEAGHGTASVFPSALTMAKASRLTAASAMLRQQDAASSLSRAISSRRQKSKTPD
jgi:hypothetical protein